MMTVMVLGTVSGCVPAAPEENLRIVHFMVNAGRTEVKLSSGYPAIGNDSVFAGLILREDGTVKAPEGVPVRDGYDFAGWYLDRECTEPWDGATAPAGSNSIYAGWKRSTVSSGSDYVEPLYNGPAAGSYSLNGMSSGELAARFRLDNSVYEDKARKYEAMEAPTPGCVLLAGSSSMENWSTSAADMSPVTSFNVGIGGTTAEQWTECLTERLVFPYSPRAVVFYVGINNVINAGCSGRETGDAVVELLAKVHERMPDADVYYVLMNLVPGYMKYKDAIGEGNSIVTDYAKDNTWLTLIDAGSNLLKENGMPNSAYFLTDGLHMSLCGYTIWGREVRDAVIRHESRS